MDVSILQIQEETSEFASFVACFHLAQILRDSRQPFPSLKVVFAARTQGACSQRRCGESPPCEVAESVIRRLQNTSSWTGSEAECRNAVCVGVLRNCTVMLEAVSLQEVLSTDPVLPMRSLAPNAPRCAHWSTQCSENRLFVMSQRNVCYIVFSSRHRAQIDCTSSQTEHFHCWRQTLPLCRPA